MPLIAIGIGLAATAIGTYFGISGSQAAATAQKQQTALEEQVTQQQQVQANLMFDRAKVEQHRQALMLRSQAVTNATNQGAGAGSGVAGGIAGVTGQETFNVNALNQNQQLGNDIYSLTFGIDRSKIAMANAQSNVALGGTLMGLGSSFMGAAGPMNSVFNQMPNPASYFIGNLSGGTGS